MTTVVQTVTLILSDGTRVRYYGLPQIDTAGGAVAARVTGVEVSVPRPLPPGMSLCTVPLKMETCRDN